MSLLTNSSPDTPNRSLTAQSERLARKPIFPTTGQIRTYDSAGVRRPSKMSTYPQPCRPSSLHLQASSLKPQASRTAFTLVELLIAMVLTLILITSIAQFYAIVGDSVKDGRAVIEMGGQMRAA